jgi:ribokinase
MADRIEVFGLGALNMDCVYRVERLVDDGETLVESDGRFPGGSAANTIYGLARLGVNTTFIASVGSDDDGRLLLDSFRNVGVDCYYIEIKPEAKTGTTLCFIDKTGQRSIYVEPGANNLLSYADLDIAAINCADLLHVSSFVADGQFNLTLKLVDALAPEVKLSFAPGALYAARGLQALTPLIARSDVLFINHSEMQQLTGCDYKEGAAVCRRLGCRMVVVTLGSGETKDVPANAACYIAAESGDCLVTVPEQAKAEVVDTTGAGDAFAAGFLFGLLKGKSAEVCGRLGGITARFKIANIGARQGLPTLTQLAKRYSELYKGNI